MKNKSSYIPYSYIRNSDGKDLSCNDLIDFASMVDNNEINAHCIKISIETGNYYMTVEEKMEIVCKVITEAPSAKIITENKLPYTVFNFSDNDKNIFYSSLKVYWKSLDFRLSDLKAKLRGIQSKHRKINSIKQII